jgi:hypothetical protein
MSEAVNQIQRDYYNDNHSKIRTQRRISYHKKIGVPEELIDEYTANKKHYVKLKDLDLDLILALINHMYEPIASNGEAGKLMAV